MDVDQPSPLEQDPAPLGMTHKQPVNYTLKHSLLYCDFLLQWKMLTSNWSSFKRKQKNKTNLFVITSSCNTDKYVFNHRLESSLVNSQNEMYTTADSNVDAMIRSIL